MPGLLLAESADKYMLLKTGMMAKRCIVRTLMQTLTLMRQIFKTPGELSGSLPNNKAESIQSLNVLTNDKTLPVYD